MQDTVRNSAIDRLSKIISESRPGDDDTGKNNSARPRKPSFHLHIGLEEGWFSLFLLATVVYSTIWSVQAVQWVDHLNILSLTTALGLIGGVLAAKQRRIPSLYVHFLVLAAGLLLALWQTAGADYAGNTGAFINGIRQWLASSLAGGTSGDDSIFLFFITALGFVLAYSSAWLVYHTRIPWLMIVANAAVLLINLSNIDPGYIIFLVIFLMASLLLVLRFNLHESVRRWRKQGLRYADDLGWDVMQAGALISIGILILSWLLPSDYINDTASQIWNANANPWVQLENTWNRVFSVSGGINPANHGNFRDILVLGGNPNLNNDIVFTVQTPEGDQYLESLSYDTYDGRAWTNGPTYTSLLNAHASTLAESDYVHLVQQAVTVVNPPGEQSPYLLGASQIASIDQPSNQLVSKSSGSLVALLGKRGMLIAGEHYTISSYVSSVDVKTLQTVPFPADSPHFPNNFNGQLPPTYYDPSILNTYDQLPKGLDANILALARQITARAPTMYDKAVALETYLRAFTYDVNIHLPAGEEGVSWFLFRSGHRGFCNYFATAMTIMARLLGMPARVVAGYTSGQPDPAHHQRVIRGTDAHTWTQIYFAGYGWINFEPSASFSSFNRPLPNQYGSGAPGTVNPGGNNHANTKGRTPRDLGTTDNGGNPVTQTPVQTQELWRKQVGLTFAGIIMLLIFSLILFSIWWKRLFRGYRMSAQMYGRISLLANWAGINIQRSQTPFEYIRTLTQATPQEAATLERFGDIYVRELWADPESTEHPRYRGEDSELPGLWKRLQPQLFLYVLRHPYFLRSLPTHLGKKLRRLRARRRAQRIFERDI